MERLTNSIPEMRKSEYLALQANRKQREAMQALQDDNGQKFNELMDESGNLRERAWLEGVKETEWEV
jgi:hypothetical protein